MACPSDVVRSAGASTKQQITSALRQASRARHSIKAGVAAAKVAGPEWEWLANSLEQVATRLQGTIELARKYRPSR
jgi:HAMP domain-containing protein